LQDGLFGVCKAYALFDEGVGYAQGINFIAMPLLFNLSEEEAFTLLVRLMSKYEIRSMFTPDMSGLHLRLYQFERLLEDLEPALYCHLRRRHVSPQLYATQWFLTLFAYRFPLQLVLRVHDLMLSEGLTAILRFGIVLMQRNREALLGMKDMSSLSTFLKEKLFDVYIDKSPDAKSMLETGFFGSVSGGGAEKELYRADEMVRDACAVQVSDELLAVYTAEWEEQLSGEQAKAEELESLRTSTTTLTARVRELETRTQAQDSEHVTIASDLVNLKLENDKLLDENEGLKMKVEELRKIADAQPAEVEEKLKEEMERIMQRNIEVQNENRSLKEECEELEGQVVEAKMVAAQARADHDSVMQKWQNVQAAMNG
ncbi:RabGAP/TBC, partial [Hortaea werneckii]